MEVSRLLAKEILILLHFSVSCCLQAHTLPILHGVNLVTVNGDENRPLNILILNAGVFSMPYTLTDDGYEATFQTNHLGHFFLVKLLLNTLIKSAPARVVAVSAECHRFVKCI
jgi:NAD(P)-dependent dehydrogenase (short-subunit alcohol dehydrogenase family)